MPRIHPVSHAVSHGDVPVWSLPGQLTRLQGAEESFESFGFSLSDPLRILEVGLFSVLLLCFLKLELLRVLLRVLEQLESSIISILLPVLLPMSDPQSSGAGLVVELG